MFYQIIDEYLKFDLRNEEVNSMCAQLKKSL